MHIMQPALFDFEAFIGSPSNDRLVVVLEALNAERLIVTLEREHPKGRKGYSVRGMWSALVAGVLYQCCSIADVVRLLKRDKDTRMVCGFSKDKLPSDDALGRFLKRLVQHERLLEECAVGKGVCKSRFRCTRSAYGYVLKLPIADDVRRQPPVPRESKKWSRLYRLRTSIERVNSRLKGRLGLGQIMVRGMAKVMVRSLLSLLVMLAVAVGMAERHRLKDPPQAG